MMRALLWKEFHEQAGRWLLATMLLAGTTSLLIHARLISVRETSVAVLLLGGMLLSMVLMIGPLPSESSNNTLEFLLAIPARRGTILFAKWLTGLLSIVGMYTATCIVGLTTAWSVGLDGTWMPKIAAPLCITMAAYHSLFFLALPPGRHELDAAIYAFFLGILAMLWSASALSDSHVLATIGIFGPAVPAFAALYYNSPAARSGMEPGRFATMLPVVLVTALTVLLWVGLPAAWLLGLFRRRRPTS
ncbi:MAG TPA: ABC transporter permease subunit [Phycisphaerae bacterium]